MFYKWIKYLAADALLRQLNDPTILTKYADQHLHSPTYPQKNLQDLHKKIGLYSIDTLRDASMILLDENEIDFWDNAWHIYDVNLQIMEAGIDAAKERKYVWKFIMPVGIRLGALIGGLYGLIQLIKILR